jgi:hypothetical protein
MEGINEIRQVRCIQANKAQQCNACSHTVLHAENNECHKECYPQPADSARCYTEVEIAKMKAESWEAKFAAWKEKVDEELFKMLGVGSDDLPDWHYADDFNDGIPSVRCARRVYKAAQGY